jgi:alanyl-tRNA synthetase
MTSRLYLDDPYLARFDAEVTGERRVGDRTGVILSRTAFYPEGGGQPADRGTLGGAEVVDVQEVDGEIVHLVAGAAPAGRVEGVVLWPRRFDHMQQHHGQHLLSAAFEAALGARTVSFHLGDEACSIDLDAPLSRLGAAALEEVERRANETVWRDLPVVARDLAPDELARIALRKEPTKGSRVVLVVGVDASPCGGTHPRRTGEVGAIAVLRAAKWGQGSRVEFACGGRVLRLLRTSSERLGAVAAALRCAPAEVSAAAARLAADLGARRKELEALVGAVAVAEAARLAGAPFDSAALRSGRTEGEVSPSPVVAELAAPVADVAGFLRATAQALVARGRTALLAGRGEGRAFLCFARPKGPGPDLGALLREAAAALGGKGGGAPDLAQGSGTEVEKLAEVLAAARAKIG